MAGFLKPENGSKITDSNQGLKRKGQKERATMEIRKGGEEKKAMVALLVAAWYPFSKNEIKSNYHNLKSKPLRRLFLSSLRFFRSCKARHHENRIS